MSDLIDRRKAIDEIRDLITEPEERTAEVIEHEMIITDTDGYAYHRTEYLCDACKKRVIGGDDYCSRCGAKLDWRE